MKMLSLIFLLLLSLTLNEKIKLSKLIKNNESLNELFKRKLSEDDNIEGEAVIEGNSQNEDDEIEGNSQNEEDIIIEINEEPINEIDKFISFRQLSGFLYDKQNNRIEFVFYGLTSKSINKSNIITMMVNLIEDGKVLDNLTEAKCHLSEDLVIENQMKQATFFCSIENITKEYSSFVFNSSNYITGIPDDDILLNPVLTEIAIRKGLIIDYSNIEAANNIPAEFNSSSIDSSDCSTSGKFKINGYFKTELKDDLNFKLSFYNPKGVSASCSLKKGEKDSTGVIECLTDSDIDNEVIIIPQTSIFDNQKIETIVIGGIESNKNITCSNGELIVVNNKLEINLAFRQVSEFNSNDGTTTFKLNAITSNTNLDGLVHLKAYLIDNNGNKEEKEVTCSFISTERISNLGKVQANYDCSVDGTCDDIEIISSEEITGINSDLDEIQKSPKLTDELIKETENYDDLSIGKLYNYSLPTYRDIFPPTLEIERVETSLCYKYGKLILIGSFDMDIKYEYDFELSLSYPSSSIKCTVSRTNRNTQVSIPCIVQKEYDEASNFIIEQMVIRKKYRETLFISSFKYEQQISCSNFNKLYAEKLQRKKESKYTFLQMNTFTPAENPTFNIFVFSEEYDQNEILNVTVFTTIEITSGLRNLEEIEAYAQCTPNRKSDSTGNIRFGCIVNSNQDLSSCKGLNIDSDEISGIPVNADPAKTDIEIREGIAPNYNDEEVFNEVLTIINNNEIDGQNCYSDGTFEIVNGVSTVEITETDDINNFDIRLSSPISSAFCDISSVVDKNIRLNCGSKDSFEINAVTLERQLIQKGNETLFLLDHTESKEAFNCIINSNYKLELFSLVTNEVTDPNISGNPEPVENPNILTNMTTKRYNNFKNGKAGLSGGAIAAIIIVCCAIVIILGVIIGLTKSGKIFVRKNDSQKSYESSSNFQVISK